jgi:DNA-binding transcriptional LysR family regulator
MDLVAACRAFVAVSGHGSFTLGAAAVRIPQSVASRRIAGLERHLGDRLLDRTSRSVALTPFGRDLLPSARRLVELADALEYDAERARLRPFRLAVPRIVAAGPLARLVAAGRQRDLRLEPYPAEPSERVELARASEVRAALVAVPSDSGRWRVPLGLAGDDDGSAPIYLSTLRPGRGNRRRARVWLQPEDDVPHVRDRFGRLAAAVGLQPAQVTVGQSLVTAGSAVLGGTDLLLCSAAQATELGLSWHPIGELRLARGYDVAATLREDAHRLDTLPAAAVGSCLGAPEVDDR